MWPGTDDSHDALRETSGQIIRRFPWQRIEMADIKMQLIYLVLATSRDNREAEPQREASLEIHSIHLFCVVSNHKT